MKTGRHIIALIIACTGMLAASGQEDSLRRWQWKGFVRDLTGGYAFGRFEETAWSRLIHNRISVTADLRSGLSARMDIRNRIMIGSLMRKTPGWADAMDPPQGGLDLSVRWIDKRDILLLSEIDRLQFTWSRETWELTVGRQRINWGINNIWNPNDLFNTYNFLDFDYEERPGSDAIRFRFFAPAERTLELAYKPGRKPGEHVAALLWRFNRRGFDHQIISGIHHRDLVIGTGWAGSIGETGFKGEGTYFHPVDHLTDTTGIFSASVMFDRTFAKETYLSASIWYTNRTPGMAGSLLNANLRLTPKSLFPYRLALQAACSKGFGSGYAFAAAMVFAPERSTFIVLPSLSREIDASWDADLTLQSMLAKDNGSFGLSGAALFLRLKHSF